MQEFIFSYTEKTTKLAFSGSPFPEIPVTDILQQIESRRAIEKKLPTWFATKDIVYPPKLNLEQTSSEATAKYKSGLIMGKTLADLTGGLGVDTYYFAETFKSVVHFETNSSLSQLAAHNLQVLQQENIQCHNKDGIEAIANDGFDVIYIDPSRRHDSKGKVFFLKDCEPNVPVHLDYLLERCNVLMVKTSPMLDISVGLKELRHVAEIHVIAIGNEVKELLWILRKGITERVMIHTINISKKGKQPFSFAHQEEVGTVFSEPLRFIYEPNAAILKSGGFSHISEAFKLKKLHPHSHLFTSDVLRDFPGRRFSIQKIVPYSKKTMRGITFEKANVTTRNFPESVASLRKKWKIKDGGNVYLFFTTLENGEKIMLICEKI